LAELPAGTVTFLFTDIEGSTRRWEERPRAMAAALQRHDEVMRTIVAQHRGAVFRTVGDAFCCAFDSVPAAVAAAVDVQLGLASEDWGDAEPIRVRMALHTGLAEVREDDYVGQAVTRIGQILPVAHGGQVVLSLGTAELARDALPAGVGLRDLGSHRLKDLPRPEHLLQLVHPALPSDFGPLRTLNALPTNATPLVGRHSEVAAVIELLYREDIRMVTLTGPGGIGKTRLAVQVAAELEDKFADGAVLISFAAIRDAALVAPTIAHSLGVRESAGVTPFESLKGYLRDQRTLLVLDGFELVATAGPLVADLLSAAPHVKVLVTSRMVLRVRGEYELGVPPLALPPATGAATPDDIERSAAVRLFIERAQATNPTFSVTPANAPTVAAICRRLEGLPLAIELAAARTRLMSPEALLSRLTNRLALLTGGARDLPERQRTLRATIEWGHELLDADEQALFRRLAVFAGGWVIDAAEKVGNAAGPLGFDVLDGLDSLLGKSLIRSMPGDGEPRFAMLETIREYALERLAVSGEHEATARAHVNYFLDLAEEANAERRGPQETDWLDRLESEHANLRAALQWADQGVDVECELRMCQALADFWVVRAHFSEGRRWLDRALSLSVGQRTPLRAALLNGSATLSRARGDWAFAEALAREALDVEEELGNEAGVAAALKHIGLQRYDQGDEEGARRYFERSLAIRERGDDRPAIADLLNNLGVLAQQRRDFSQAWDYLDRALTVLRGVGDEEGIARLMMNQGAVALDERDMQRAAVLLRDATNRFHALANTWDLADCLEALASALSGLGYHRRAARLFGAAEGLRSAIGAVRPPPEQEAYDRYVAAARASMPAAVLDAEWASGRTMTVGQAADFALTEPDDESGSDLGEAPGSDPGEARGSDLDIQIAADVAAQTDSGASQR